MTTVMDSGFGGMVIAKLLDSKFLRLPYMGARAGVETREMALSMKPADVPVLAGCYTLSCQLRKRDGIASLIPPTKSFLADLPQALILATPSTANSGKLVLPNTEVIAAPPDLPHLIDRGHAAAASHELIRIVYSSYFTVLPEVIFLGCTHYIACVPWLAAEFDLPVFSALDVLMAIRCGK